MAIMSDQDRFSTWAQYMRENTESIAISKTDLRAAINALDDFLHTNAATINATLPVAARNGLTTSQKAALLSAVIAKRYLSGV